MPTECQMFWRAARRQPQATALVGEDGNVSFSYAALLHEVEVVAAGLLEAGVTPGAIVATVLPDSVEHVLAPLALSRAGAIPAPISPRLKPAQAARLVREAEMAAAIAGPGTGLQAAVTGALGPRARLISTGAGGRGCVRFSSCRGEPSGLPPIPQPRPADPAVIFYTSGTTGPPKGVVVPHQAVWARHLVPLLPPGSGGRHRFEGHMPICHPAGYHGVLLGALTSGGTYYVVPAFDTQRMAAPARPRTRFPPGRSASCSPTPGAAWRSPDTPAVPAPPRPRWPAAGTGPATWPSSTATATSGSPAAPTT